MKGFLLMATLISATFAFREGDEIHFPIAPWAWRMEWNDQIGSYDESDFGADTRSFFDDETDEEFVKALEQDGHELTKEQMEHPGARSQQAMMAENYLAKDFKCLKRRFCQIATAHRGGFSEDDREVALTSVTVLEKVMKTIPEENKNKFQHIQGVIAAFKVGKNSNDVELCNQLFACQQSDRITCDQTGKLCPAISISCGLCGLFFPPACAVTCPVAGIYCGIAGYSC